jgi:hypothetical protein
MPATRTAAKEQAIREHAYYLWERDGRPHGRDLDYWARAVAELTAITRRTGAKAAAGDPAGAKKPAETKPASPATAPAARKPRTRQSA